MRQIFASLPYFIPADPPIVSELFARCGTRRVIRRGEVLKRGGDDARLFYLESGLCTYTVLNTASGRRSRLSVILPGRAMGDLTAGVGNRCNVITEVLEGGVLVTMAPERLQEALELDPGLAARWAANAIAKEESIIEGVYANATHEAETRMRIFAAAALAICNVPERDGWKTMPFEMSASVVGELLNLNRVTVAKITAKWFDAGVARREGRRIAVRPEHLSDLYDWYEGV